MKKYKINDEIIYAESVVDAVKKVKDSWIGQKVETIYGEGIVVNFEERNGQKQWQVKLPSGDFVKTTRIKFNGFQYDSKTRDEEPNYDYLTEEEQKAVEDYKNAIKNTTDPKLLDLFAHILREETEHIEELKNAKEGIVETEDSVKDSSYRIGNVEFETDENNKTYYIGSFIGFNQRMNEDNIRKYGEDCIKAADEIRKLESKGYKLTK